MIEKIDNNQIPDISRDSATKQSAESAGSKADQPDASLQVSYNSLIEKAKLPPQPDPDAVQQARQLILDGKLDSPENIRTTAENIAELGI